MFKLVSKYKPSENKHEVIKELKKEHPTLPLVYINKSLYKQKHFS